MVAICAAGLIVSLILTLRHSPLSFLLYGLVFLFYLFVFRKQSKRYQKAVKTAALEECLRPFLKNISYQEKDGLDPKAILNSFCRQQPERRASKPHLYLYKSRLWNRNSRKAGQSPSEAVRFYSRQNCCSAWRTAFPHFYQKPLSVHKKRITQNWNYSPDSAA